MRINYKRPVFLLVGQFIIALELVITENITEICQYFACFFDIASPESHPELWHRHATQFGPRRIDNNPYPEEVVSNTLLLMTSPSTLAMLAHSVNVG